MTTVRIGASAVVKNSGLVQWLGSVKLQVGSKVTALQKRIGDGVKSHFNVRASGPSRPGTFPYRLSGQAVKSIVITDYSKPDFVGFKIGTTPDYAGSKLPRLKRGFVISPSKRTLAIPVSYEARLHSSKWNGSTSGWVRYFPAKLTFVRWGDLRPKRNNKPQQGLKQKSSLGFLGELVSDTKRPKSRASSGAQKDSYFQELRARSLFGRGGDARTGKYITLPNGKQYKVHYVIARKSMHVQQRLGVTDALRIELAQIGKVW